jgi:hypothetical protein
VLKEDRGLCVLAGDSPAGPVVVKRMVMERLGDRLKMALGWSRLARQWRGAEALARKGVAVARPIVLWRGRDERGRVVESLAMERVRGETVLRRMARRGVPPAERRALAEALGAQVGALARRGLMNRDHKPSNLVLRGDGPGAPATIVVLDTVAIRRSRPWPALVRMLFSLVVEPAGCGVGIPASLRLRAVRASVRAAGLPGDPGAHARRLWHEVRDRLARHGDPTPRVDPLRPAAPGAAHKG